MPASLPPVLTTFLTEVTALRTASRAAHVNAFSPVLAEHGPVRLEQLKQKLFVLNLKWVRESSHGSFSCMKKQL